MVYDFETDRWRSHVILREQKTKKTNRIFLNKKVLKALEKLRHISDFSKKQHVFVSNHPNSLHLSRSQDDRDKVFENIQL